MASRAVIGAFGALWRQFSIRLDRPRFALECISPDSNQTANHQIIEMDTIVAYAVTTFVKSIGFMYVATVGTQQLPVLAPFSAFDGLFKSACTWGIFMALFMYTTPWLSRPLDPSMKLCVACELSAASVVLTFMQTDDLRNSSYCSVGHHYHTC